MRITAAGLNPLSDLLTSMGTGLARLKCTDLAAPSGPDVHIGGENPVAIDFETFALAVNQTSNEKSVPPFSGIVQVQVYSLYGAHRGTLSPWLDPEAVPAWLAKEGA